MVRAVDLPAASLAALTASQRFLVAAMMALRPAAESLRLLLVGSVEIGRRGADRVRDSAQRFRCASLMRFLAAALNFRRFRLVG